MIGAFRSNDPSTSVEAALNVPVSKLEDMFVVALKLHPAGLTTTEIANYYRMDRDSFSPRAQPLLRKNVIEKCGKRWCQNSAGKMRQMLAFRLRREAPL